MITVNKEHTPEIYNNLIKMIRWHQQASDFSSDPARYAIVRGGKIALSDGVSMVYYDTSCDHYDDGYYSIDFAKNKISLEYICPLDVEVKQHCERLFTTRSNAAMYHVDGETLSGMLSHALYVAARDGICFDAIRVHDILKKFPKCKEYCATLRVYGDKVRISANNTDIQIIIAIIEGCKWR